MDDKLSDLTPDEENRLFNVLGFSDAGKPAPVPAPIQVKDEWTNLDGVKVKVGPATLQYINYLMKEKGYTVEKALRGTVGYSELAMHTRNAERIGIVAFLHPKGYGYAYVLMDDGNVLDGCFYSPPEWDGKFSVS